LIEAVMLSILELTNTNNEGVVGVGVVSSFFLQEKTQNVTKTSNIFFMLKN